MGNFLSLMRWKRTAVPEVIVLPEHDSTDSDDSRSSNSDDSSVHLRDLDGNPDFLAYQHFIAQGRLVILKDVLNRMKTQDNRPLTRMRCQEYVVDPFVEWNDSLIRNVTFDAELRRYIADLQGLILQVMNRVMQIEEETNYEETSETIDTDEDPEGTEREEDSSESTEGSDSDTESIKEKKETKDPKEEEK